MLSKAERRAADLGREATFQVVDAEHLEFGDEKFDTVVTTLGLCTFAKWKNPNTAAASPLNTSAPITPWGVLPASALLPRRGRLCSSAACQRSSQERASPATGRRALAVFRQPRRAMPIVPPRNLNERANRVTYPTSGQGR
jgi:Methyltransferase domain